MGRQIVYCQVCGSRILESDLQAGKAISVQGHNYCSDCRDQAPASVIAKASRPPEPTPPKTPAPPVAHRSEIHRPRMAVPSRPASKPPMGLIVGGALGGIALIAIVVVFAMPSGRSPNPTPTTSGGRPTVPGTSEMVARDDPHKAARKEHDALVAFSRQRESDPEAVVAKLKESMPKFAATPFEANLRSILADFEARLARIKLDRAVSDLLDQAAKKEREDPEFRNRGAVQDLIDAARRMAGDRPDLADRVLSAERGFHQRFEDAARAAANTRLENAQRELSANRFEEAEAALDGFPESFSGTQAARDIARLREEIRQRSEAHARENSLDGKLRTAMNALNADQSEASWRRAAEVFEEVIRGLQDPDVVRRERIARNQALTMLAASHYYLAWHQSRWMKDVNSALKNLEESFKCGFARWDDLERTPYLEDVRKDSRFAPMVEKYKKMADPNRRRMGFNGQPLGEPDLRALGIKEPAGAVRVVGIVENSPADKAGLKEGDVLLSVAGKPLGRTDPFEDIRLTLENVKPDTDYDVFIVRDGEKRTLKIRWDE